MTEFLASMGEATTWLTSQAGKIGEMIVSTPVLFLPIGIFVVGGCIGLFKRLLG